MKKRLLVIFSLLLGLALSTKAQVIMQPAEPNTACMEAWQNYHKADILWNTGWGLFGGGLATATITIPFAIGSAFGNGARPPEDRDPKMVITNKCLWSTFYIACGAVVASIPCLAVGQVRRKAALKSYNEWNCESSLSCEQINNYNKNGETIWKTGWGLFGAGLGLTAVGTIIVTTIYSPTTEPNPDRPLPPGLEKGAYAMIGVGCAATIASFPCLGVGQVRRHAASRLYNEKCSDQPILTFNIQTSANGLGIAMQF